MLYVRSLTRAERSALYALHRHGSFHLARRARILLLSASGYSVPAIAQMCKCCRRSVRSWIHAFHRGGLEALAGRVMGRPPRSRRCLRLCPLPPLSAMTSLQGGSTPCECTTPTRLVPVIPLTVPELRRLLDELIWNRRRCPAFVLHWSVYRRYKQALAKRSHYLKRGAEPPQFLQLRLLY
jgi:Homeodomain-like domain